MKMNNGESTQRTEKKSKGAVYTIFIAPSRPKNESVTDRRTNGRTNQPTNQPTDGPTEKWLYESRSYATEGLKNIKGHIKKCNDQP